MRTCSGLGVVTGVLLTVVGVLSAAETPWETIEWQNMDQAQRFEWGLSLFRMGREADSAEILTRVIAASPEARTVAALHEKLTPTLRLSMLEEPKTTQAVQDWIKLYESSIDKLRRDDAYIAETAGRLTSAAVPERERATRHLLQLGEFAVPHVIRLMHQTEKAEDRVACRKVLLRLGRSAVLPTVEYLSSDDDALRVALLQVLAALRDVRAQAAVCRLAVDREANPVVRETAMNSLMNLLHQPRPGLVLSRRPTVNYWRLADAYLHEEPFALPTMTGDELPVWTWSDEKKWVTCRMVPRPLYNEEMAEEACYDGLEIDRNDAPLRSMAIAVYYAQKLELVGTDASEVNHSLEMAILVGGKYALQRCMAKALADGDLGIAIQAAQTLGEVGEGKGFSAVEQIETVNPLLAALAHEDRAVQFSAARAVARCRPHVVQPADEVPGGRPGEPLSTGQFDNYWRVLPALSWGLMYELPSRTVLIVHPDTGVVNYYKGEVRKLGHTVVDATTVQEGMRLAGRLPQPDVVLLSSEFLPAIDGFRAMMATDRVPVVVLLGDDQADAVERVSRVAAGALAGRATDKNISLVLKTVMDVPEKKLVTDLIGHISERAATALAGLLPETTPLPMNTVEAALRRNLASKDDTVRLPALRALGNIAASESALDVLAVAADKRAAKPVRLAALDALASILKAQRQVPPDVFADLVPISSEEDAEISLAAARAITVARFDPAQFADLMVLKRVREITTGVRP